jgi:starvation-inducible DNA-binding protein
MTNIGLESNEVQTSVQHLERFLSSQDILNLKIRNFHWNVTGPHFSDYHKFFEEMYDSSAELIDDIAERIRMLGKKSPATMDFFLKNSFLQEQPNYDLQAEKMVAELVSDTEKTISEMRKAIEEIGETMDKGTEDFLIATMQDHEKNAWMLRSMIK